MASITLKHITKSFGENVILRDFHESFGDGEFVTLLGPSGCGKSTILRIIAGFEKPSSGEVWIGDRLVSGGKEFVPPEKRGIGMVFQSYAVWPHMTVFDNVAYPLRIHRTPGEEIRTRTERALSITHLGKYAERFPSQLSGGQQQRIALARALVAEPELLLLDEPLSNLDAKLRESMRFEIKELQKKLGITVVYVTHDQAEAMAMSDRIFLIHRGIVQQAAPPEEIYNQPANQFVADFLGKVDFFRGRAGSGRITLPGMNGQVLAYDGPLSGSVDVAVRPENVVILPAAASAAAPGEQAGTILEGILESIYYLGDSTDCRVRVGESLVRVVAAGRDYRRLSAGERVRLQILEYRCFPDDGSLQEMLEIRT